MNYDFNTSAESLHIPKSAYSPVKRCPYCQSVYLTDKLCEACGRSMQYHPIGEPFGPKSFYGLKERYIESQHVFYRFFPVFEDFNSQLANSYKRNLSKRFADLISAFNADEAIVKENRKLFYAESMEIIDELLRYNIPAVIIQTLLEENDNSLVGQELLLYLQNSNEQKMNSKRWQQEFLDYKVWGVLRLEFFMKVVLVTATIVFMAVKYKEFISSQLGK
jgi:hypothetical protein